MYDSNNLVCLSDHRPVFAQFVLGFKMNKNGDQEGVEGVENELLVGNTVSGLGKSSSEMGRVRTKVCPCVIF